MPVRLCDERLFIPSSSKCLDELDSRNISLASQQGTGSFGLKRHEMEALPALEIIAVVGAGFEGVDLAAARERGIVVTYGGGLSCPQPNSMSCSSTRDLSTSRG